jgi:hypothetical protein
VGFSAEWRAGSEERLIPIRAREEDATDSQSPVSPHWLIEGGFREISPIARRRHRSLDARRVGWRAGHFGPDLALVTPAATDVWRRTTVNIDLPTAGKQLSDPILFVRLPAGNWVLSLDATAVAFGSSDFRRCAIYSNNQGLNGATAVVGADGGVGSSTLVGNISTTAIVRAANVFAASVICQHDNSRVVPPKVDAGATL